jgi:hypothetical protein
VADAGEISGIVLGGIEPLGGVTISTVDNGKPVTATTPTVGAVGRFVLKPLTSPATYVITFSKPGYGTRTLAVPLGPGEANVMPPVQLEGGTGTVTGRVTGPDGQPLGNVAVTANGGTTELTTNTANADGSYQLSGLPTPGTYSVTFSAAGYASRTLPVGLVTHGFANNINVQLLSSVAELSGTVLANGVGLTDVAITLTDGQNVVNTKTVTAPTRGGFAFPDLPAGTYTVTFTADGFATQVRLVHLKAGPPTTLNVTMGS